MTQYNITSKAAIAIYRENRRYVVNKMTGPFWRQAIWIDFVNRNNVQWSHVEYFLNTFSDVFERNWYFIWWFYWFQKSFYLRACWYCVNLLTDALIAKHKDRDEYRMDTIWYHLYLMKNQVGNSYRFCNLFECCSPFYW